MIWTIYVWSVATGLASLVVLAYWDAKNGVEVEKEDIVYVIALMFVPFLQWLPPALVVRGVWHRLRRGEM